LTPPQKPTLLQIPILQWAITIAPGTTALQVAENVGANPKSLQMDLWHIGSIHEQFDNSNTLMDFMSEQDHSSSEPLFSNMETMEINPPWVSRSQEGARSTEDVY
jgi:hypothetical protein